MEHFLDIIIPEYNCKEEFMKRLLNSISRQKNVNFDEIGIIIVNDKSKDKLRKGLFKNFPKLNIEYYLKDVNEGVGMTRQYGLDRSTAKYVTFVDQDDELYGNDSLGKILNYLKKNDYNYVVTQYIEEVRTKDGGIYPLLHDKLDAKEVLHGVFIKKQLLIDNSIRFIPGIKYHDDSYLRRVLLFVSPAIFIKEITYVWKANIESIVRRERKYDYMVETFDDYFLALKNTNLYAKKRNIDVAEYTFNSILSLFCILESKDFMTPELSEKREKNEIELYDFICQNNYDIELYIDRYDDFYKEVVKVTNRSTSNCETLSDFITRLSKKVNDKAYKIINNERVLDCIVSCEHNDIDLIKRVYTSLKNQLYVNKIEIGLIFVVSNDFDTSLFDIGEDKKSYNIEFVQNENIRDSYFNVGLKKSTSKYVTFIKDTDVLNGPYELSVIIKRLKLDNNNLIVTKYIKFNSVTNERGYFDSLSFDDVLGMFFNRKYIINNYNFGDELGIYGERYFSQICGSSVKAVGLSLNSFISYVDYKANFIQNPLDVLTIYENINGYIKMNYQITKFLLSNKIGDNNYYLMLFYTSYIFLYSCCINKGTKDVAALSEYYKFLLDNNVVGNKEFFDKVFEEVTTKNTLFLIDIFYDDNFEKCLDFIKKYKSDEM